MQRGIPFHLKENKKIRNKLSHVCEDKPPYHFLFHQFYLKNRKSSLKWNTFDYTEILNVRTVDVHNSFYST